MSNSNYTHCKNLLHTVSEKWNSENVESEIQVDETVKLYVSDDSEIWNFETIYDFGQLKLSKLELLQFIELEEN